MKEYCYIREEQVAAFQFKENTRESLDALKQAIEEFQEVVQFEIDDKTGDLLIDFEDSGFVLQMGDWLVYRFDDMDLDIIEPEESWVIWPDNRFKSQFKSMLLEEE